MTIAITAPEGLPTNVATLIHLGDSGIVFGQTDAAGVLWKCTSANVWGPKPAPREQSGDRAYDHGQWDATRFYGPRVWELAGTVHAPDHGALHWAEQRLRDAVDINLFEIRAIEPGFDGTVLARQQGQVVWTEVTPTLAQYSIGLYAPDPLIYSSIERTFSLGYPSYSGGLQWPATWPATWTGSAVTGYVTVTNPCSRDVPLQLVATGPVNNLRIVNTTTGQALLINNPDGDTLTAGQTLAIDTARHQVLLMGTASRRSWASGEWPVLAPGDNVLAITGANTTADSTLVGSFRAVRL